VVELIAIEATARATLGVLASEPVEESLQLVDTSEQVVRAE
jgi:hypothetical protein